MDPVLSVESPPAGPPDVRRPPPPPNGGPLALLRFMRRHRMLTVGYAKLLVRFAWLKLRWRGRVQTDGLAFVCPGVTLEIAPGARLVLGRWSWLGHGCKIRVHEGTVSIGAKTVLGQECTISAFQHVSIGRECIVADRVMVIDFDHGVVEVERPIRLQGIYKRDVDVGLDERLAREAAAGRGARVAGGRRPRRFGPLLLGKRGWHFEARSVRFFRRNRIKFRAAAAAFVSGQIL